MGGEVVELVDRPWHVNIGMTSTSTERQHQHVYRRGRRAPWQSPGCQRVAEIRHFKQELESNIKFKSSYKLS